MPSPVHPDPTSSEPPALPDAVAAWMADPASSDTRPLPAPADDQHWDTRPEPTPGDDHHWDDAPLHGDDDAPPPDGFEAPVARPRAPREDDRWAEGYTEDAMAQGFVAEYGTTLRALGGGWMMWREVRTDTTGEIVAGGHWSEASDVEAGYLVRLYTRQLVERLEASAGDLTAKLAEEAAKPRLAEADLNELTAAVTAAEAEGTADTVAAAQDELAAQLEAHRSPERMKSMKGAMRAMHGTAERIRSERSMAAVLRLAKGDPGLVSRGTDFDADPWLLNVANGTLDLRLGKLHPHRLSDRITHRVEITYDPAAKCPTWGKAVHDVFCGDAELVEWFRRAVGYTLTGSTTEQALFFCYGDGANGKSTLLNVLGWLLGQDLYSKVPAKALMAAGNSDGTSASPHVYSLRGARFALTSELPDGRLDSETIKDLVSSDDLTARLLNRNPVTWTPSHKLWMYGNHQPTLEGGGDGGVRRRLRLIPFLARFPQSDGSLEDALRAELPGILAWAVQASLEWQRVGLGSCSAVDGATAQYFADSDTLGEFITECCVVGPELRIVASDLYGVYSLWARRNGYGVLSSNRLGRQLKTKGFGSGHDSSGTKRVRVGLSLSEEGKRLARIGAQS